MTPRKLWTRANSAYARRMARWFGRRPFRIEARPAIVTFTFDDFPRTSLSPAGSMLEQAGISATYFTALGLAGKTIEAGEMFVPDDLPRVLAKGHEFGCHTFDHCPAWETPPERYLASVDKNRRAFAASAERVTLDTHSYPISYPRPRAKHGLGRRFRACRGGGQAPNTGIADLNYLKSFFLEQCGENIRVVEQAVAQAVQQGGWLIFSTHDVAPACTRFGCSPDFFQQVIEAAVRSGAVVAPMSKALDLLGAGARL